MARMECPRCGEIVMIMPGSSPQAPMKHYLKGTNSECAENG